MTAPSPDFVPGLDPVAAQRWLQRQHMAHLWLQDEVARRMAERLAWIVHKPQDWLAYWPHGGGAAGLRAVQAQCAQAREWWPAGSVKLRPQAPWWRRGWLAKATSAPQALDEQATHAVDLVWANMALHVLPQPQAVLAQWLRQLRVQGFVMCSGLGPDSLQELRAIYAQMGWPAPAQSLTDMHDWGDMLVQTGFAEPVMDMERMTLAYESPDKLLSDLRAWGRNLSSHRFAACRGRGFQQALRQALLKHMPRNAEGQMTLTLEIIYGHAVKPAPRAKASEHTTVSLQDMKNMLKPGV